MTFVTSKIIDGTFYGESDSMLTIQKDYDYVTRDWDQSLLKIIIIHDKICISYAGGVEDANKAFKEIFGSGVF